MNIANLRRSWNKKGHPSIYSCPQVENAIREHFPDWDDDTVKKLVPFITAAMTSGYNGKISYIETYCNMHRTTLSRFLEKVDWDSDKFIQVRKQIVLEVIQKQHEKTGEPICVIIDDTSDPKTQPSSKAENPIEGAYWHYSHLLNTNVYGMQVVGVMLSCGGLELHYAFGYYDQEKKEKSKIKIAIDEINELPIVDCGYVYCDSWYTCKELVNAALARGYRVIGAIKRNRNLYVAGEGDLDKMKIQIQDYFFTLCGDIYANTHVMTIQGKDYLALRFEGQLHGIDNAVVIMTMPVNAHNDKKALRAFLCMDPSLSTQQILERYCDRWPIEVFFRFMKSRLRFDKFQIRGIRGIVRLWNILSYVHLLCCIGTGEQLPFHKGRAYWEHVINCSVVTNIYEAGANGVPIENVLAQIA